VPVDAPILCPGEDRHAGQLGAVGVSSATFYAWKAKYGGMDVSDAKRLKALEEENGKLKRLLADAMLDNTALKDLLGRKW
jgi:putative transposase